MADAPSQNGMLAVGRGQPEIERKKTGRSYWVGALTLEGASATGTGTVG